MYTTFTVRKTAQDGRTSRDQEEGLRDGGDDAESVVASQRRLELGLARELISAGPASIGPGLLHRVAKPGVRSALEGFVMRWGMRGVHVIEDLRVDRDTLATFLQAVEQHLQEQEHEHEHQLPQEPDHGVVMDMLAELEQALANAFRAAGADRDRTKFLTSFQDNHRVQRLFDGYVAAHGIRGVLALKAQAQV